MSPECIYRVANRQKDQGYWGNRYFSGWSSQKWLFVAQSERKTRDFSRRCLEQPEGGYVLGSWAEYLGEFGLLVTAVFEWFHPLGVPSLWKSSQTFGVLRGQGQHLPSPWGEREELQAWQRKLCHGTGVVSWSLLALSARERGGVSVLPHQSCFSRSFCREGGSNDTQWCCRGCGFATG